MHVYDDGGRNLYKKVRFRPPSFPFQLSSDFNELKSINISEIEKFLPTTESILKDYITEDFERVMSKYNKAHGYAYDATVIYGDTVFIVKGVPVNV